MDDKDRIVFLIHDKGLSNVEFSALTGIAPATISHITRGRSKPTLPIMKGILNGFPDLNPEWVFLGTGPMYKINKENIEGAEPMSSGSGDTLDLFSNMPMDDGSVLGNRSQVKGGVSQKAFGLDLRETIKESMFAALGQQKRKIVEVRIFFDDGTYEAFSTPKPKP